MAQQPRKGLKNPFDSIIWTLVLGLILTAIIALVVFYAF